MRLSIVPLIAYQNNNSFKLTTEWSVRFEAQDLYFQLVDTDQDGIRYMTSDPAATVSVTFPGLDGNLVKSAVKANSADSSIWKVSLTDSDTFGSGNIQIAVTESGSTKTFWAYSVLSVEPCNPGGCSGCGGGCGGAC